MKIYVELMNKIDLIFYKKKNQINLYKYAPSSLLNSVKQNQGTT